MMILPPNNKNLAGRLIFFPFILSGLYFLFHLGLHDPDLQYIIWNQVHLKAVHFIYIIITSFVMSLLFVLISYLNVIKIMVDEYTGTITFYRLLRTRTIPINDITGYFATTNRNALKTWEGLLLKTNSGG